MPQRSDGTNGPEHWRSADHYAELFAESFLECSQETCGGGAIVTVPPLCREEHQGPKRLNYGPEVTYLLKMESGLGLKGSESRARRP